MWESERIFAFAFFSFFFFFKIRVGAVSGNLCFWGFKEREREKAVNSFSLFFVFFVPKNSMCIKRKRR